MGTICTVSESNTASSVFGTIKLTQNKPKPGPFQELNNKEVLPSHFEAVICDPTSRDNDMRAVGITEQLAITQLLHSISDMHAYEVSSLIRCKNAVGA